LTNVGGKVNNGFTNAMYRRPKFLDILLDIRSSMSAEADNDIGDFVQAIRSGKPAPARQRTVTCIDSDALQDAKDPLGATVEWIDAVKE
jgi:hypothetical protein